MVSASQALQSLQRLLEVLREFLNRSDGRKYQKTPCSEKPVERNPRLITGHYVDLDCDSGATARVYYEESGKGIPLVLLHTACADSRQYHELLCDTELANKWHMFAFDLPYHGRSVPPGRWWESAYILSSKTYAEWCLTFLKDIVHDRAVVLGCSMGAVMAIFLASHHREYVGAAIAFEAPDRSPARRSQFLCNPQVNQAAHNPSYAYGLMSPSSPEVYRKKAWWYYSQGGYGVYEGDLHFYIEEWDGARMLGKIDTKECPVYLFSGEYDYSAPHDKVKELADRIPGAKFTVLESLGHFPMVENPDLFRFYLKPVLEEIENIYKKSSKRDIHRI